MSLDHLSTAQLEQRKKLDRLLTHKFMNIADIGPLSALMQIRNLLVLEYEEHAPFVKRLLAIEPGEPLYHTNERDGWCPALLEFAREHQIDLRPIDEVENHREGEDTEENFIAFREFLSGSPDEHEAFFDKAFLSDPDGNVDVVMILDYAQKHGFRISREDILEFMTQYSEGDIELTDLEWSKLT